MICYRCLKIVLISHFIFFPRHTRLIYWWPLIWPFTISQVQIQNSAIGFSIYDYATEQLDPMTDFDVVAPTPLLSVFEIWMPWSFSPISCYYPTFSPIPKHPPGKGVCVKSNHFFTVSDIRLSLINNVHNDFFYRHTGRQTDTKEETLPSKSRTDFIQTE